MDPRNPVRNEATASAGTCCEASKESEVETLKEPALGFRESPIGPVKSSESSCSESSMTDSDGEVGCRLVAGQEPSSSGSLRPLLCSKPRCRSGALSQLSCEAPCWTLQEYVLKWLRHASLR